MTERTCAIADCDTKATRRGWCDTHYRRWLHHGSTGSPLSRRDDPFTRIFRQNDGCWVWLGAKTWQGYGKLRVTIPETGRRANSAHRAFYERFVGPIPDGLELDHLCRNPSCVNPAHLEPVTQAENRRRSLSASGHVMRTNTCKRGHELTSENTYVIPSRPTHRHCRKCIRLRYERQRDKRRSASPMGLD